MKPYVLLATLTLTPGTIAIARDTGPHELIATSDQRDVNLVLNVLWSAWQRSVATHTLSREGLYTLESAQDDWHAMIRRRRNPSKDALLHHVRDPHIRTECMQRHEHLRACYHSALTHYAMLTEFAFKTHPPHNHALGDYLRSVQEHARTHIICGSLASISQLQREIERLLARPLTRTSSAVLSRSTHRIRAPWDTICSLAHAATMRGFIEFDRQFNTRIQEIGNVYIELNALYNKMWEIMECARAQWYLEAYTSWYRAMQHAQLPSSAFFAYHVSEDALPIAPSADLLPDPATLSPYFLQ